MPKKCLYDVESLELAINDVKSNKLSLRAAAKKYGVPKSTLEFKFKNPGHKNTCGPSPILSVREESMLVAWIKELASRGFPRKKDDILNSVQEFLIENPRPTLLKITDLANVGLRRHPTIVQRTAEAVSSSSACVSEADIRKWFAEIECYLQSKNMSMDDPSRVFNGDETGFQICPITGKVFAGKGTKNIYSIDKGSQKENITVMFSFSASGMTCPPMIIYPYKRIPEKIAVTVNSKWGIGRSDNGWMTSQTFHDYIKNIFYPHLIKENVQLPVVLFLDGHKSHLTYELSILCNDLNIEIIALYPNATRILQPCDVALFRPIKVGWKKAVRESYEKNPGQVLNKTTFAPLLEKVVTEVVKPDALKNGFKACGLFPFNSNAIDYSKCLGKVTKPADVTHDHHVRDRTTFIDFVGDDIISKFKTFDAVLNEGFSSEFLTLHQMWSYFGKPDNEKNQTDHVQNVGIEILETETELKEPGSELKKRNLELEDLSYSEVTYIPLKGSDIKLEERIPLTSEPSLCKSGTDTITLENKLDMVAEQLTDSRKVCIIENIIIKPKNSTNELTTSITDTSLASTSKNDKPNFPFTLNEPSVDENVNSITSTSLNLQSTSNTCISVYLKVPDKPQRKNKRNVERISFALTSKSYQESFEAKRAFKLEEENKKLERKRLREEKSASKAKLNNKRVSKSKQAINNENCFVCKKRLIKSSHYLTCDGCKNNIHRFCIPNKHKKHIPDLEDDELFLCHICYKEESDDDVDSEEYIDDNEDKENSFRGEQNKIIANKTGKDNSIATKNQDIHKDDDEEIDELYNMYKDQCAKMF